MFKTQSGLDKLTAEIESALGGKNSKSTSGTTSYSADENDMNSHNDVNYHKYDSNVTRKTKTAGKSDPEKKMAQCLQLNDHKQQTNYNMYKTNGHGYEGMRPAQQTQEECNARYAESHVISHHSIAAVSNSTISDNESSAAKRNNKILRTDFRTSKNEYILESFYMQSRE